MKYRNSLLSGAFCTGLLVLSACGTPQQIAYFQDFNQNPDTQVNLKSAVITAKPTDKLYIGVKSKDPQITQLFSLTGTATSYSTSIIAKDAYYYTVDSKGNIDFPVLGTLHVAGRTREQIAEGIKKLLVDRNLVKDPVVTVSLTNLHYSVIGEVARPGQYEIEDEKVTILDALSKAGDLTIYGTREDVMVLRQENGHQKIYKINLCSGNSVFNSPVYYLQQNDVVYISPNETKARQSTVNGNNVRSTGFWISLASLATSVAVLIKK